MYFHRVRMVRVLLVQGFLCVVLFCSVLRSFLPESLLKAPWELPSQARVVSNV